MAQLKPATLNQTAKEREALELRVRGYSPREIAIKMGTREKTVNALITRAHRKNLARLQESVEAHVAIQLRQIDHATKFLFERMMGTPEDPRLEPGEGLARNIEILIKLMERKAKLLGLDAPDKSVSLVGGMDLSRLSPEEIRMEAERMGISLPPPDSPEVGLLLPGEEALPSTPLTLQSAEGALLSPEGADHTPPSAQPAELTPPLPPEPPPG